MGGDWVWLWEAVRGRGQVGVEGLLVKPTEEMVQLHSPQCPSHPALPSGVSLEDQVC